MSKGKQAELTAADIWAMFAKTDEQMKKTDEKLDKLCGKVGGMDENIGHHAEQFFQDSFAQTLTFGGVKYDRIRPNLSDSDKTGGVEFDIVLINGKCVAIIEVKNRIHPTFVKELTTEKLDKFRKHFPEYKNHKVYLGVAGFSFCDKVLEDAKKYGVGIIKQVGQSIEMDADKLKAY